MTVARAVTVSAQYLAAGGGGIAGVARLSIQALPTGMAVNALAVEDSADHTIGLVPVRAFAGNRGRFVAANARCLLQGRTIIYDFAGTARAHLPLLGRRSRYAVWIHGTEAWGYPVPRPDYFAAIRGADLVLANSQYTLDRARETIGPLANAHLCWLGTEHDDAPAPILDADRPPMVLFVGRNDNILAKGQDILINIWPTVVAAVPTARLVFAGGGSHLGTVRDLARASTVAANIDVLGFVAMAEMEKLWCRATAFALLSHVEGFGLVFTEAMRYGVPVIASTDDASSEVNLDGVTGYNVARSRPSDATDRIIALLRNPDLARSLGRAGFDRWHRHFRYSAFEQRFRATTRDLLTH